MRRRISQYTPRHTSKDRKFNIAMCVVLLMTGVALAGISYLFLGYTDEIARATHDNDQLVGSLGIISTLGSFLCFIGIPLLISEM